MRFLIAGGSGFLGSNVRKALELEQHEVITLTRRRPQTTQQLHWDGRTITGWGEVVSEVDAVLHLAGFGLEHWPWSPRQKQKFVDSRVLPGKALVSAITAARRRPTVFLQASGVNRYGLQGKGVADESTAPASDFLAQVTVPWEAVSEPLVNLGVRRIVVRNAIVLDRRAGLFPLMALPTRLFLGGRFGSGAQAVPWIHLQDWVRAVQFLLDNSQAEGPYNLIAPSLTTNAEFMQTVARTLHRPCWLHLPEFLLRAGMGEMSNLLTKGRFSEPKRLLELGFQFRFGDLRLALDDLLG